MKELNWLEQKPKWYGLKSVVKVESIRQVGKKMTCESRYYLSSLTEVEPVSGAIREHWAIENKQHWILDVQFGEDGHRARKNHSAENLAVVRRTALNLLQQDSSNNEYPKT